MSDKVFIGPDVADLDYGEKKVISKVILTRSSDTWFEAGDGTGDTLECSNPWATQAMADAILAELQDSPAYLPYTAADALMFPRGVCYTGSKGRYGRKNHEQSVQIV